MTIETMLRNFLTNNDIEATKAAAEQYLTKAEESKAIKAANARANREPGRKAIRKALANNAVLTAAEIASSEAGKQAGLTTAKIAGLIKGMADVSVVPGRPNKYSM